MLVQNAMTWSGVSGELNFEAKARMAATWEEEEEIDCTILTAASGLMRECLTYCSTSATCFDDELAEHTCCTRSLVGMETPFSVRLASHTSDFSVRLGSDTSDTSPS